MGGHRAAQREFPSASSLGLLPREHLAIRARVVALQIPVMPSGALPGRRPTAFGAAAAAGVGMAAVGRELGMAMLAGAGDLSGHFGVFPLSFCFGHFS